MIRKLRNRAGFTLAETLLTVLILLLVSILLMTGVPTAINAYNRVVLTANAQVLLSTAVDELRDEIGTAWDVTVSEKAISYYSGDTGAMSVLSIGNEDGKKGLYVQEFNEAVEFESINLGNKIAENERQLAAMVNNSSFKSELYVTAEKISFGKDADGNENKGIVIVKNLEVYKVGADSQPV